MAELVRWEDGAWVDSVADGGICRALRSLLRCCVHFCVDNRSVLVCRGGGGAAPGEELGEVGRAVWAHVEAVTAQCVRPLAQRGICRGCPHSRPPRVVPAAELARQQQEEEEAWQEEQEEEGRGGAGEEEGLGA